VLPFRNAMEYWNADGLVNHGDELSTYDINLVGLCAVPLEFTHLVTHLVWPHQQDSPTREA